jgi:DNA-binding transcriptional regulator YdaS (Cro superfamily)
MKQDRDGGLIEALDKAGGPVALARRLTELGPKPISHAAISQWNRVPAERVRTVSQVTGVPLSRLRPDLFMQTRKRNV